MYKNGIADIYNVSKQGSGRHHNFFEFDFNVPDHVSLKARCIVIIVAIKEASCM
jgi:hypothetical protein